nr:hypothetical protein [Tanacetum cinerariifolium]
IAQSLVLPLVADELASSLRDDSQGEACPTDFGLVVDQDRANITKTSTLPSDSTPRVTSLAADEGRLSCWRTAKEEVLHNLDMMPQSRGGVWMKGMKQLKQEVTTQRKWLTVLTSLDAATVLSSGVAEVPTGNGSIPTVGPPATRVPTGSEVVPTFSPIFTTAIEELEEEMVRDAQRMNEQIAKDAKIARIHAEEELQRMIDGLDRNNETVSKYLQEYHQFATELLIGKRIELISDLVKYQDNYAKVLKY